MAEDRLVAVYDAYTEVEAVLYRSMLEEAGIDVVELPLEVEWFEGVRQRNLHSRLLVSAEDAERARELIVAFHEEAQTGELSTELPPEGADTAPPPDDFPPE
jgi:hypothetical protein